MLDKHHRCGNPEPRPGSFTNAGHRGQRSERRFLVAHPVRNAQMEVRALTGVGAEEEVVR
jgi:hypothetical protein